MKRCPRCEETKPREAFARNKRRKDGLQTECRACSAERTRMRREADPERYRESVRNNVRAFRASNPAYREEELRKNRERNRLRYHNDPEYRARLLESKRPGRRHRHYLERGAAPGSEVITLADEDAILDRYDFRCAYCGGSLDPLHWDHVVPLALGGLHAFHNLRPACAECNLSKGAKLLEEWLSGRLASL